MTHTEPPWKSPRIADARRGVRHVFIRDMVLSAQIGVTASEKRASQRVRINVDLAVEDEGARPLSRERVGQDRLARVVDYEPIAASVRRIVKEGHIGLVETLAERIAEACLEDRRVLAARVRIEKLDIFADAASVGVEIERRRA
ncbi:MAG TPA: dihydroneopterin aldolase [Acetobacteraceae bacterium]|nr:dihydroneopterin aldolase [Acetobacteraceae bacterium]